jgi:hypothetical protein
LVGSECFLVEWFYVLFVELRFGMAIFAIDLLAAKKQVWVSILVSYV